MSVFRPELHDGKAAATISDETALSLIYKAVAKRRVLIHGKLDGEKGQHCALGAFWDDNPNAVLNTDLVDEVAAVNDSVPKTASPRERWKFVSGWLRFKIAAIAGGKQ